MTDYLASRDPQTDLRIRTSPQTPRSSAPFFAPWDDELPLIDIGESFGQVVTKFIGYFNKVIDAAYTYQQLRTTFGGQTLKPLIVKLSDDCHHPAVVAALLAARYILDTENDEGTGLNESRGLACEIVAWQFLTFLTEKELIDYLLYEVPDVSAKRASRKSSTLFRVGQSGSISNSTENTPLLANRAALQTCDNVESTLHPPERTNAEASIDATNDVDTDDVFGVTANDEILKSLAGMNALEVGVVAGAKNFLGQRPVQKIVDDIWRGNVVFWESLSVEATRKARTYNKKVADPFTRLRVPQYQKAFQIGFFISFLVVYYAALARPSALQFTLTEALLYWWMAAFAYDELGEIQDAGLLFYKVDFWSLWDMGIIGVSVAFVIIRMYGLIRQDEEIAILAFNVLSMVALFLVPRIFSVMSLNPYFGTLIPVLKEMAKAFINFLPVIFVLYFGFLTTFAMLAKSQMSFKEVAYLLVEVFFGSSFLGFDLSHKINPHFGFPLMLIFVCLTNFLLVASLISLVSNSLAEVMAHARTEYLFQYSIYVLESSSSRRLTYFMPPLNLISLFLLRPLRLVLSSEDVRRVRILVLKATHIGFIALIWAYEAMTRLVTRGSQASSKFTRSDQLTQRPLSAGLQIERERYARRPCPDFTLSKATSTNAPNDLVPGVTESEIVKLIQKLSSQVDELSAMVAGQQKG